MHRRQSKWFEPRVSVIRLVRSSGWQKCSSSLKLEILLLVSSCYCFRARGMVSVVCSIVCKKSIKPFVWNLTSAGTRPLGEGSSEQNFCWWTFRQPEQKSSLESSEKYFSVDLVRLRWWVSAAVTILWTVFQLRVKCGSCHWSVVVTLSPSLESNFVINLSFCKAPVAVGIFWGVFVISW